MLQLMFFETAYDYRRLQCDQITSAAVALPSTVFSAAAHHSEGFHAARFSCYNFLVSSCYNLLVM